jgi:2-polyprenyl-3-methyl-5-hydroxy-6-metoxy-1,4-benzoquinol methylase
LKTYLAAWHDAVVHNPGILPFIEIGKRDGANMAILLKDKIDWIIPKVKGRKVLDLGCVRHNLAETRKQTWLHGLIAAVAREVLGVDYLQTEVDVLRQAGYNVLCANVETMELPDKYEVVVAGDIIEHLNNFGLFLAQVKRCMKDDGVLLVTTPNPVNFLRFMRVLVASKVGANPEHSCWFTEEVLTQLAERYGLIKTEVVYVDDSSQYYQKLKWRPFVWVNSILCRLRPQYAETICIEFVNRNA